MKRMMLIFLLAACCGTAFAATPSLHARAVPAMAASAPTFPPVPTGTYEVALTWSFTQGSDLATGFDVYRAVSGASAYQLLNTTPVPVATLSYADTTVANNTAYAYYVVSVDASGNQSAPSNLITVTTPNPPSAPANLAGASQGR